MINPCLIHQHVISLVAIEMDKTCCSSGLTQPLGFGGAVMHDVSSQRIR